MWLRTRTIARNVIYLQFSDRNALIFMFMAPLSISLLMGLAFGGGSTSDINLPDATLIVINQDEGSSTPVGEVNYGQMVFMDFLVDNPPEGLADLITGTAGENAEDARTKVENGGINAVLLIPPEFSGAASRGDGQVTLYFNPGEAIAATIIITIVEQITAGLNAGLVAQDVLVSFPDGYFLTLSSDIAAITAAGEAAIPAVMSANMSDYITLETVNVEGEVEEFRPLAYFGPGMAILFMTFAMAAGTRGILQEQQNWTMQRILTTPTPRWVYLMGRLLGTYTSGLIQMGILLVATPLIALITGNDPNVWGSNYPGILLMTLAVVFAGTGLGLLLAGISKTAQQADTVGTAVLFFMAMLGGSFFPLDQTPILDQVSRVTLNYWGLKGYNDLAVNFAAFVDILPNAAVLAGMGGIFFMIALWRFGKRLDI